MSIQVTKFLNSSSSPRSVARRVALLVVAALFASTCRAQVDANYCGSLANAFGPFDYRPEFFRPAPADTQPHSEKLHLVEIGHFTPPVESLVRGQTSTLPGPDLDYTLRAIPNHHRALAAVTKLWERTKVPAPGGLPRPAECYFERAIRFAANDNIARLLFASFLIKGGRVAEAVQQLERVKRDAGENPFTRFNLGMVYADAKMYDEALAEAHLAMKLGLPRRELRERLEAAGKWLEPDVSRSNSALPMPQAGASSGAVR